MHLYDKDGNLKMIIDYKDVKPEISWRLGSWIKRLKWKMRQIARKLLP